MTDHFDDSESPYAPPSVASEIDGADTSPNEKAAKTGFVLGLVGIVAWLIPIVGLPVTIIGIVKSSNGLDSPARGKAVAGLVLSIVFLLLTIVNAGAGAYLAAKDHL